MADVRSMLRSERVARRIDHPYASYTKSGLLTCSLCNVPVKSESKWDAHLHSKQHADATERASSRKRKAEEDFEHESKKTRHATDTEVTDETYPGREVEQDQAVEDAHTADDEAAPNSTVVDNGPDDVPTDTTLDPVNEDEWAAFEAEMQNLEERERERDVKSQTIYAAAADPTPRTAAETSTGSAERAERDADLEGDKEEAARQMEEEFGEMEELEERVKRLKERRQALRRQSDANEQEGTVVEDQDRPPEVDQAEGESEDDDEEGDWDV